MIVAGVREPEVGSPFLRWAATFGPPGSEQIGATITVQGRNAAGRLGPAARAKA